MKCFQKRVPTYFLLISLLILLLLGPMCYGCASRSSLGSSETSTEHSAQQIDENETKRFHDYLDELFCKEISTNVLNMHYTLTNPADYGINSYEVGFGTISKEDFDSSLSALENNKAVLQQFDSASLPKADRLTIDILNSYADTGLSFSDYYLYDEILKPNTGFQAELPVLLAEYRFTCRQDVFDYLALLADIDRYFDEIIRFETEKSDAGLFMSDFAVDTILKQCSDFCRTEKEHFLITTFDDRLAPMDEFSDSEKQTLKNRNRSLVENHILSAYQGLSEALTTLKGTGKNNAGLCYLPHGKVYYTNLVHKLTGSSHTVEELEAMTEARRTADLTTSAKLLAENPKLSSGASSLFVDTSDPAKCLQDLISRITEDFPAPVSTDFTINYVDECLQDSMAPAFYLTAPIDDWGHNSIYINPAGNSEGIELFTTLAHEGFPGHLYQTVMSYDAGLSPLRSLLSYPGYVEGWATYVEMMSYHYAGLPEDGATLLAANQSAILSLYATADMGIHYDGWSLADTIQFFREYGIKDIDTVQHIFEYIVEEPAHYLKYYIGYLEFMELRDYAKQQLGTDYSNVPFHQAVLSMGPAPFDLLQKYFFEFYNTASSK